MLLDVFFECFYGAVVYFCVVFVVVVELVVPLHVLRDAGLGNA